MVVNVSINIKLYKKKKLRTDGRSNLLEFEEQKMKFDGFYVFMNMHFIIYIL
jgi:hypothetical protein